MEPIVDTDMCHLYGEDVGITSGLEMWPTLLRSSTLNSIFLV